MTETVKSSPDETKKDSTSSAKSSSKVLKHSIDGNDATKASEKPEKPLTKVVVRRLPPSMTLESFVDQVSPLPPVDYMYFVKADSSLAPNSFSRAYLHFVHVHDLLIFTEKFDNYVFLDNKGNEYPAIVEYAPFQRIPRQRTSRKKDPRAGTIDNDQYYLEFVEALKLEEAQRKAASKTNKQHFFETSTGTAIQKVTSTPLLEYLKERRAEKLRLRDERERERRKKENEKRSSRTTTRFSKTSEGDGDGVFVKPTPIPKDPVTIPSPDLAEIQTRYLRCMIGLDADTSGQVQGGGGGPNATDSKNHKDYNEHKRPVKETIIRRREDDKPRVREKDRDRRDREKERDQRIEVRQRRDHRDHRDNRVREHGADTDKDRDQDQDKDDSRPKETRKVGKSYQEERQRLNERRLAAKNINIKNDNSTINESTEKVTDKCVNDLLSDGQEKTTYNRKSTDSGPESKLRSYDKYKSDQGRPQSSKENRKTERSNKYLKDYDVRQNNEAKGDDRFQKTSQESLDKTDSKKGGTRNDNRRSEKHGGDNLKTTTEKILHRDIKHDQSAKFQPKEDVRKKSYNLERENRRASDRKVPFKKDSVHASKSEDKLKTTKDVVSSKSESSLDTKCTAEKNSKDDNEQNASGDHAVRERRHSLNAHDEANNQKEEPSRRKSISDSKANAKADTSSRKKTDKEAKTEGKDKKDPRAERRIRNKDRPSMEIYRPGMGRFSRQRLEQEKGRGKERDPPSSSPSPVSNKS